LVSAASGGRFVTSPQASMAKPSGAGGAGKKTKEVTGTSWVGKIFRTHKRPACGGEGGPQTGPLSGMVADPVIQEKRAARGPPWGQAGKAGDGPKGKGQVIRVGQWFRWKDRWWGDPCKPGGGGGDAPWGDGGDFRGGARFFSRSRGFSGPTKDLCFPGFPCRQRWRGRGRGGPANRSPSGRFLAVDSGTLGCTGPGGSDVFHVTRPAHPRGR